MFGSWGRKKAQAVTKEIKEIKEEEKSTKFHKSPNKSRRVNSVRFEEENENARVSFEQTPLAQEMKEEYERKIKVLSQCLEEKAEENITLHEKLTKEERIKKNLLKEAEHTKDLEILITELNTLLSDKSEKLKALEKAYESKNQESFELQVLNDEFQRRISVLSTCLEEMAQENLGYWTDTNEKQKHQSETIQLDDKNDDNKNLESESASSSSKNSSVNTVEAKLIELTMKQDISRAGEQNIALHKEIEELREELSNAEEKLQTKEKKIVQLNNKLIDAVNKKNSYAESNDLYEEKLKDLEQELMENLNQEGIRRQEAEYIASKLKKKVAELQFLLDERDQDSDSSYYSDEE